MENTIKQHFIPFELQKSHFTLWFQGVVMLIVYVIILFFMFYIHRFHGFGVDIFLVGANIFGVILMLGSLKRQTRLFEKRYSFTPGDIEQICDMDILAGMYGDKDQDGNPYNDDEIRRRIRVRNDRSDRKYDTVKLLTRAELERILDNHEIMGTKYQNAVRELEYRK